VTEQRDHELGHPKLRTRLLDLQSGTEANLLPDLSAARLMWAENNLPRFAGIERVDNANYAQTWRPRWLKEQPDAAHSALRATQASHLPRNTRSSMRAWSAVSELTRTW
jgi:hypothetical protein